MPQLTLIHARGQGLTGRGPRASWDCKWMDVEAEPADRRQNVQSLIPTPDDGGPHHWSWSQALRTLNLWRGWYSVAPIGVVWLFCQTEVLLHPSSPADICWSLLLLCFLWMVLGSCVHALRCRLQPGQKRGEDLQRLQREEVMENRNIQYSWASQSRSPGLHLPVAVALADSLLLCVLQEPLPDPDVPHIQALIFRLESVSRTLEKAETGSEGTSDKVDQDSKVMDKVRLICSYLQRRMRSLRTLVQVQGEFEASVKDMLEGLDDLWAQLEKLHTGVTLTKEGSHGHGDLALARADAGNLFSVLGHYRNRLQCCQTHLSGSTQLLQELTWTHTHMSNSVRGAESVWPELLLQSNIEQFDKVQESFLSVEQQTSTFQAHLEGLSKGNQEGRARPLTSTNGADSCSVPSQTSPCLHNGHTSTSSSSPGPDAHTETDAPLSLCERSALQFTSTFGRLRKSAKRK